MLIILFFSLFIFFLDKHDSTVAESTAKSIFVNHSLILYKYNININIITFNIENDITNEDTFPLISILEANLIEEPNLESKYAYIFKIK